MNGITASVDKPVTEVESPKDEPKPSKSGVREKLMHIRSSITVEPIIACYIMSNVFSGLAVQNLNLEKACRVNLGYSDEVCSALNQRQTENYTTEEAEVQKLTASVQAWKNIVQTAFPCILLLFVGAWSDKTGKRKACILVPIVGEVLCCTSHILNTYFFYELPLELTALSDLFPSLTGGWITVCVGVFSYIGDVTTKEMRTFRVGVANLCMSLGIPIGMSLSGILLQQIGYYGIFFISNCLYLTSLIYGYIRLKDPVISQERQQELPTGCRGWLWSFFDARHVKETLTVAFRSGPRRRRLRVSLLIVVVCVIFGPLHGEMNVLYLFMRYRFNWNEVQFSMFCTYSIITNLAGTLFSISIFSDFMKLDDTVVGIISCTSKILASFIFAFATTTFEIYMAPLVEIFNGTSFIAMRSIASKLVTSEELGKVNSLFGLAEAMMPLVYGPLYSRVYMATLNIMPGTVFLLGAAMTVPAVAIFGWMYFEQQKDNSIEETENVNKNV
ncbi:probable peptidoglycan muropeptide transporter SLC46 [Plodia interpunctella]|uniref:probable peptidoglycan muropeptide transporter SLC46 n=1 Tax=Plodia interpunctella TaxID=58824 RepID=UPI0023683EC9|nr:proton-coupled folate transporter-like [Plodia interpunctella]